MSEFVQTCDVCKTKADCKHAFGIYWAYKSSMGKGCNYPFAYKRPAHAHLPPPTRKPVQGNLT